MNEQLSGLTCSFFPTSNPCLHLNELKAKTQHMNHVTIKCKGQQGLHFPLLYSQVACSGLKSPTSFIFCGFKCCSSALKPTLQRLSTCSYQIGGVWIWDYSGSWHWAFKQTATLPDVSIWPYFELTKLNTYCSIQVLVSADLLVNPTTKECKQSLLTRDVHEGPLPYIVHGVALCWGNVDRQHDVIFHILQDQVVHYNIDIVHHTPDQTLHITYKNISIQMRNMLNDTISRHRNDKQKA